MLAPLGDYGGPTLTMEPLAGSPVIDVIANADCSAGQTNITVGPAGRSAAGSPLRSRWCYAMPAPSRCYADTPVTPVTPIGPPAASPIAVTPAFTG